MWLCPVEGMSCLVKHALSSVACFYFYWKYFIVEWLFYSRFLHIEYGVFFTVKFQLLRRDLGWLIYIVVFTKIWFLNVVIYSESPFFARKLGDVLGEGKKNHSPISISRKKWISIIFVLPIFLRQNWSFNSVQLCFERAII